MLEGLCGVCYLSGCDGLDLAIQTEQGKKGAGKGICYRAKISMGFLSGFTMGAVITISYRIRCSLVSSHLISFDPSFFTRKAA